MYEIHDLVSRANQTIKSSIVSSLNLIIALYTPLATIVLQLASLVWVAWYVPILIAVFNVPYIFILVKSNHRRYELERKITKEKGWRNILSNCYRIDMPQKTLGLTIW